MINLQTQFNKFHDAIKVDFDDTQLLRNKRDLIIDDLKYGLRLTLFPEKSPKFQQFNQGSYDLGTGVKPLAGKDCEIDKDYDIDVGIVFNFSKNDYSPVQVKELVSKALNTSSRTVEIKTSCVRVQHHLNQEKWFHVDLAIYSRDYDSRGNVIYHIAKGSAGSYEYEKVWELSEPFKFKKLLNLKIPDSSERAQFNRVVRYLKRWKDYNFDSVVAVMPTGIALTACCYHLFTPEKYNSYTTDANQPKFKFNDLKALQKVVNGIARMFTWNNHISVELPVEPYNDLFEKMSFSKIASMESKLVSLQKALFYAANETNYFDACMKLRQVFGDDFPLP